MEKQDKFEIITTEFFKRRFPDKDLTFEKECGYFYEWINRFKTNEPEGYMDKESLKVWEGMKDFVEKLMEIKINETRTEKLENLLKLMTEQMIKVFESNNLLLVENLRLMKEVEELKK